MILPKVKDAAPGPLGQELILHCYIVLCCFRNCNYFKFSLTAIPETRFEILGKNFHIENLKFKSLNNQLQNEHGHC